MLLLLRVLLGERKKRDKRIVAWSIISIASPTHYLQKQAAKTLGNTSARLWAVRHADNLWHIMKDIVQARQPTAEWMEVTIYCIWVPKSTANEFSSTTGTGPEVLVKQSLLFENLVQLEWRNIKPAHQNMKAIHLKHLLHTTRELLTLTSFLTQPVYMDRQLQWPFGKHMDGWVSFLWSLQKNIRVVGRTIIKHAMTQACKNFKAELKEKIISAAGRDPLCASYEKWTDLIAISWVCCSHLCSS